MAASEQTYEQMGPDGYRKDDKVLDTKDSCKA